MQDLVPRREAPGDLEVTRQRLWLIIMIGKYGLDIVTLRESGYLGTRVAMQYMQVATQLLQARLEFLNAMPYELHTSFIPKIAPRNTKTQYTDLDSARA